MPRRRSKNTGLFRKVGGIILGERRPPHKLKQTEVKKKARPSRPYEREIPKKLRGFFERRHAGWPEYVMLKVQTAIIALFVTVVVYLVFLQNQLFILIPLLIAISTYLAYITLTELRIAFKTDFPAYRSFVAICVSAAWVFVIALRYSATTFSPETLQLAIIPPLAAIGFVAFAFGAFRIKYGRNYTYGKVESVQGRRAVVRVSYDIRSNLKAGLYPAESFIGVRRGDVVKIGVERPMLGLRGARVKAVLEKAR